MNETSTEPAVADEALPAYLARYAADVDRWHDESRRARRPA